MNAVIYARTSCTAPNARSIDDQVAACRALCDREGWSVVSIFADQMSSGDTAHQACPALVAMLLSIDSGGIDQIVAETSDRIARRQSDFSAILERITLAGTRLVTVAESYVPDLTLKILTLFDAAFRRDLAADIMRGRRAVGVSPSDDSMA